ncbi:MAG: lipopolysaccharide biosynthesis protein, partial [Candidatus Omnitrophota bacterium]
MSWIKAIIKIGRNLLKPGKSLSQKVVRSTFWMGAFKVTERTLRFIRTIIVARLLSPTDFGLFGLACLAMDILERFSETGMNAALIQKKEKTEEYLDTAWTINLIRNIFLFSLLFFGAPFIAKFFNNLSAAPLIRVIAVIMIVRGLTNIGAVYFIKEFDFRKQFVLRTVGIIVNVVVTLTLAFILRNAWALVWGYLAQSVANCIASYILHPYRPKLQLELPKAKELLNFGKWIFGSSILIFLITQGDDILVGKVLGLTALGLYQMAYAIANLPATEITHVISQVTFPAYSKLQDNLPKLREAYLKVLQLTAFISFPIAGLIFALAPDFTKLFLGEKWMPMVPAMQILVIGGAIRSIGATIGPIFQGVGRPDILTKSMFAQLLILAVSIYPLIFKLGITGASIAVVIPGLIVNT